PSASDAWMRYFSPSQRPKSMVLQRALQKGNCGHSDGPCPSITLSQTGQRTLIIGNSAGILGPFLCLFLARLARTGAGLGGLAGCIGLRRRLVRCVGRFVRGLLRLGRRLVRLAAVVGLVEAGTLENDAGAAAEQAAQLRLAALRALLQRLLGERLE